MMRRVFECRECKGRACRVIQVFQDGIGPVAPCKAKMRMVSICEIPDGGEGLPPPLAARRPAGERTGNDPATA